MSSSVYPNFQFNVKVRAQNSKARIGEIVTPHGIVETPNFIFCATKAAIKALSPVQMKEAGTQIILSNTYHLMLSPGGEVVERLGGLHKFMGWNGPMFTDSGGFQVFSLGHGSVASEIKGKRMTHRPKTMLKITEEGVTFKSYLDGSLHVLTPEKSMEVQRQLGADLVVVFDECTPFHVDKSYTAQSMRLSHRWGERSLKAFKNHNTGAQALYGIIQGGVYPDLRKESCDFVNSQDFFAHAIGGSLGASKEQMYEVVAMAMEELDPKRPVHLLGIGGLRDIFKGVREGIDTFDCVHPTRLARHGGALVKPSSQDTAGNREHISIKNSVYKFDEGPLEEGCPCQTCATFSRAYLHYAFRAQELIAIQAITLHNVSFMNRFMQAIRQGIIEDNLDTVEKSWMG